MNGCFGRNLSMTEPCAAACLEAPDVTLFSFFPFPSLASFLCLGARVTMMMIPAFAAVYSGAHLLYGLHGWKTTCSRMHTTVLVAQVGGYE